MAKIYYIVNEKYCARTNGDRVTYQSGTLERLNEYYGEQAKTIASLISRVNKAYDWQYGATYTRRSIRKLDATELAIVRAGELNIQEL